MSIRRFSIFSGVLMLALFLIVSDHLTSQSLSEVVAPNSGGGACAPCGAPCK